MSFKRYINLNDAEIAKQYHPSGKHDTDCMKSGAQLGAASQDTWQGFF